MNRTLAWRMLIVSAVACCISRDDARGRDTRNEHVLFQAIRRGDASLVRNLLQRGTPPDVRSGDGSTPLMMAALHGTSEMVDLLLTHGANARAANDKGVTPLLWGAADVDKVRLLLEHGGDPNARSGLGNTPLIVAAASPRGASSVAELLAHGGDMTLENKRGRTPLRVAVSGGDVDSVRLILERAKELEQLDKVVRGAGPSVAIAATQGSPEIVNLLLEYGADPEAQNGTRGHAVNAAFMAGNAEIARSLIERGVDLECLTRPGDVPTVLWAAYSETGDASIVTLLKEQGADFTAKNADRETALTWANLRGHRELIQALHEAGAEEGAVPERPETPAKSIDLHAGNQSRLIAAAVQKSIDLLQQSSDTFLDVRRNCVSCHHQNVPGVAIAWARDRGFRVRQETLDRMVTRQIENWSPRIDRAYELDSPFPVPPRFLGYGMWGFAELGHQPDELTRAVSSYLAATQQSDGRWESGMLRPPMGGDDILSTMLAMRSLQLYPVVGREDEMADRIDHARDWLQQAVPRTHQERVCRMLGLSWAGLAPGELERERRSLLDTQRADGGWSQLPNLESDAWATGQALVALHTAAGLPTNHPAYRRGVEMLLGTQFDDGSWFVQSRSWPFQSYFESDFPHGRDQWISAPATAWAVMGLVLAVEPTEVARHAARVPPKAAAVAEGRGPAEASTPVELVPAVTRAVRFADDVEPLLVRSCLGCHGDEKPKSNFSLRSRDAVLRGGDSELPAIVPGASEDSPLVRFAAGLEEAMEMPPVGVRDKYPPLTAEEIAVLRGWIDQGAPWPDDTATPQP